MCPAKTQAGVHLGLGTIGIVRIVGEAQRQSRTSVALDCRNRIIFAQVAFGEARLSRSAWLTSALKTACGADVWRVAADVVGARDADQPEKRRCNEQQPEVGRVCPLRAADRDLI